jgi:hypothetical protein
MANREPNTQTSVLRYEHLLSFAVTENLAEGRDLRIPRDLSSIVKKKDRDTRLHSTFSDLICSRLSSHTRSRDKHSAFRDAISRSCRRVKRATAGNDSPWQPAAPNSSCAAPRSGSPGRSWEEQDAHMDFSFLAGAVDVDVDEISGEKHCSAALPRVRRAHCCSFFAQLSKMISPK